MLARALVWTALLSVTAAVPTANDQYPDLLPADCGRRQIQLGDTTRPFIVGEGNTTAYYGQYPWQARLLTYDPRVRGFTHQCGAIIITDHHVLTAAHCVQDVAKSSILVRVGELRLVRSDAEFAVKEFGVASIHIHYLFTGAPGLPNDIALLHLRIRPGDNLQFNAYVAPACLPAASAVYETNLPCEVSGWGRTDDFSPISEQLRGVEVPLISDEFCSTPEVYQDRFVTGRMFCAGLTLGGVDACRGDSGGPLACMDEGRGRFMAYGIVSSGDRLGCGLRPGLYTKMSFYINWIQRRLQLDREDEIVEIIKTGSEAGCGPITFRPPTDIGAARIQSTTHFPWMVQVFTSGRTSCGGVIVAEHWILTAHLCLVQNKTVTVKMGATKSGTNTFPVQMEVDHVELQPPPKELSRKPVFALLRTKNPIRFSENVKPICLPDDSSLSPVRPGLDLIFVGWGLPKFGFSSRGLNLKWARLRVVDLDGCRANYSTLPGFESKDAEQFHDDTFCTKFLQRNEEFECGVGQGDTGGVFMDRVTTSSGRESWRVLGTAVAGVGCGHEKYPDINAALGPAMPWVRSVVDSDAFLSVLLGE